MYILGWILAVPVIFMGYAGIKSILKLQKDKDVFLVYIHENENFDYLNNICEKNAKFAVSYKMMFEPEDNFATDTIRQTMNCTNEFICTNNKYNTTPKMLGAKNYDYLGVSGDMKLKMPTHLWIVSRRMHMYVNWVEKEDTKTFYHVFINQIPYTQKKSLGYMAIYKAMEILKTYYPGEYIICGSFGVPRWDLFFKHFLPNYHIMCSIYATRRIENDYSSLDGILISKKMYESVHFSVGRFDRSVLLTATGISKSIFLPETSTHASKHWPITNEVLIHHPKKDRLLINETLTLDGSNLYLIPSEIILN